MSFYFKMCSYSLQPDTRKVVERLFFSVTKIQIKKFSVSYVMNCVFFCNENPM